MSAPCPTFGFIVYGASDHDASGLCNELAARLADTGLVVDHAAGHAAGRASALVVTREGSQATESDRQLVLELLNAFPNAAAVKVSELVDLSY